MMCDDFERTIDVLGSVGIDGRWWSYMVAMRDFIGVQNWIEKGGILFITSEECVAIEN